MKTNIAKLSVTLLCASSLFMPVPALFKIAKKEHDGEFSEGYFRYGVTNIPHDTKKEKGGEDAWMASNNFLMVADGVGGWIKQGIDSGIYSKSLVAEAKKILDADPSHELRQILIESVNMIPNIKGSSTVIMAKFDTSKRNHIKTANLGDSGYMIIRPNPKQGGKFKKIFRSVEQQRKFNNPYQVGTGHENEAYLAVDTDHEIVDKDIMVMFSDGVSDNLYDNDIAKCIKPYLDGVNFPDPKKCSDCIANAAYEKGNLENYESPFAINAKDAGFEFPMRGKSDDIVAICAQIHIDGSEQPLQEIDTNGLGLEGYESEWQATLNDGASMAREGEL